MIAINEVPSPFDKEMEEDSDEEEGPATQPGHAETAAMPIGCAQMCTLYILHPFLQPLL